MILDYNWSLCSRKKESKTFHWSFFTKGDRQSFARNGINIAHLYLETMECCLEVSSNPVFYDSGKISWINRSTAALENIWGVSTRSATIWRRHYSARKAMFQRSENVLIKWEIVEFKMSLKIYHDATNINRKQQMYMW